MTLDKTSWGYRRNTNLTDYLTTKELIKILAETISCGGKVYTKFVLRLSGTCVVGNLCINVGPTKEGVIAPIFQQRLFDLGKWLAINGEAIYESSPWKAQNDTLTRAWYTYKNPSVYAIVLDWPKNSTVNLAAVRRLFDGGVTKVELLGFPDELTVRN